MSLINILIVCLLSLVVSVLSISVGGTSLITVPLLISLGMISKNAVATNMFGLIFLSMSGAIGFRKEMPAVPYRILALFFLLTIGGSLIGASFLLTIDKDVLKKVIAVMVCVMAGTFLFKKDLGVRERKANISKIKYMSCAILIFILAIYGGFFSGGYVTVLSYVLILIIGLNFLQAAFITKIFNLSSSLVACVFFYIHGLIDFSVGIPLAFSMSLGALLGTKLAIAKGLTWIKRLFILAVLLLAIKLLFF